MPNLPARAILSSPARGLKALSRAVFGYAWGMGTSLWMPTRFRARRKIGTGRDNSIVAATLGWLQRNITQAPPRIRKPAGDGENFTAVLAGTQGAGRMLDLLEEPNPHYDWAALLKASAADYVLDGNFYWLIVGNKHGAPTELWWAPASMIEPMRRLGSEEFITHYEYRPDGVVIELSPDDVVHGRDGMDPENPMKGLSRVRAVLQEVLTDEEASAYTATLLENMGVPGIIVSPEEGSAAMGTPEDGELDKVKAKIEQSTKGSNRGRPLVMRGPTRVTQFGFNPQQMSLKELRRLPEERITAAIGVPAVVVGMGAGLDRSTFANMAEAREAATEEALIPLWLDIARVIKKQLLPKFDSQWKQLLVDFDLAEVRVLREDQDKLAERMSKLVTSGIATVANAKEKLGLKVEPADDIYLRPANLIEVPAGHSAHDLQAAAPEPPEDDDQADDVDDEDDPDGEPDPPGKRRGVKAAGATHAGAMVALYLDDASAKALALEDGEAPEQLHVTLAFFEDLAADREDWSTIEPLVTNVARRHLPLEGSLNGQGVFHTPDADAHWASVDVPELDALRRDLVDALDTAGFPIRKDHGFTPHITVRYDADRGDAPDLDLVEPRSVKFDELVLTVGGSRTALKQRSKERVFPVANQRSLILTLEGDQKTLIPPFARDLEGAFKQLGEHVAANWAANGGGKSRTKAEGGELTDQEILLIERTIDASELPLWRKNVLGPIFKRNHDAITRRTLKTLVASLGIEIGAEDRIAVEVLERGGKQLDLVDITSQSRSAIFEALADGKAAGEGVPQLERRIRTYVENGSSGSKVSARATRIAREETMTAQRISTRLGYKDSGFCETLIAWDNRVGFNDADCIDRNGREFTFDEAAREEALEHINGTLSWAPGRLVG